MIDEITIVKNRTGIAEIASFLTENAQQIAVPQCQDYKHGYAEKLAEHATRFEARTPDGKLVGLVAVYFNAETQRAWVPYVCVVQQYQNRGIAHRLFEALIAEANGRGLTTIALEVRQNNTNARKFYEKLGFRGTETIDEKLQLARTLAGDFWRDDLDPRPVTVSVRCFVYNQEKYIRQTLDSIVAQQTDFRFEAIVHDDASTDGTPEIIKEYAKRYPSIIKPILEQENLYSRHDGSLTRVMNEHDRGEYTAFCEGDDYWIDPLKLQKQIDLLRANSGCGLCYAKAKGLIEPENRFEPYLIGHPTTPEEMILKNAVPTLTVVIRTDLMMRYFDECSRPTWLAGDYPMWLFTMMNSEGFCFLDEEVAIYRELPNSMSHSTSFAAAERFRLSIAQIQQEFNDKYAIISPDILHDSINRELYRMAYEHDNAKAIMKYFKAIRHKRLNDITRFPRYMANALFHPNKTKA